MKYQDFLKAKQSHVKPVGFDVDAGDINQKLFDWQAQVVKWALRRGRAALFEDCGLGKTAQQLEWARLVAKHTGKSIDEVRAKTDRDFYMGPEEAKAFGVIDEIFIPRKEGV